MRSTRQRSTLIGGIPVTTSFANVITHVKANAGARSYIAGVTQYGMVGMWFNAGTGTGASAAVMHGELDLSVVQDSGFFDGYSYTFDDPVVTWDSDGVTVESAASKNSELMIATMDYPIASVTAGALLMPSCYATATVEVDDALPSDCYMTVGISGDDDYTSTDSRMTGGVVVKTVTGVKEAYCVTRFRATAVWATATGGTLSPSLAFQDLAFDGIPRGSNTNHLTTAGFGVTDGGVIPARPSTNFTPISAYLPDGFHGISINAHSAGSAVCRVKVSKAQLVFTKLLG